MNTLEKMDSGNREVTDKGCALQLLFSMPTGGLE